MPFPSTTKLERATRTSYPALRFTSRRLGRREEPGGNGGTRPNQKPDTTVEIGGPALPCPTPTVGVKACERSPIVSSSAHL